MAAGESMTEQARQTIPRLGIADEEQEELFRQLVAGLNCSPDSSFLDRARETLHKFKGAFAATCQGFARFRLLDPLIKYAG